ncbi:beta-lactamase-like protein [Globomyces pollinis-pini]|nr:beta-lactamase-like protein [Globomyces pollinis-pini]
MVDPGEGIPAYAELLQKSLVQENVSTISKILCTHRHKGFPYSITDSDHVKGVHQVRDLMGYQIPAYKRLVPSDTNDEYNFIDIPDNQIFDIEGATLRAIHTPGHTDDHVSFLLEEENAIFTGDCVLGQGSAIFENLSDIMNSLSSLLTLNPKILYPGHGPTVFDGPKKITEYINNRLDREKAIIQLLQTNDMTSGDLTKTIYKGYPESILEAAERSVILHLQKLMEEKRVVVNQDTYRYLQ